MRGSRTAVRVAGRMRWGTFGATGLMLAVVTALSLTMAAPADAQTAGRVLAWGSNDDGQLGIGTTGGDFDVPVQTVLPAGATATAVAGGGEHSLAITSAGVLAWGLNASGQLGTGNDENADTAVPVQIPAGTVITEIAAGDSHSLALTSTGRVLAWGDNGEGELGNSTVGQTSNVPVEVSIPPGVTVTGIAAGGDHSLAVTSTGQALAWGFNGFGELGNGSSGNGSNAPVPVSLPAGTAVTEVAAGEDHSVARTATGGALAWGLNDQGQLGNGTTDNSDIPLPVSIPSGTSVTAVATGASADHTVALTSVGQVLAWGANGSGQLGNGTTNGSDLPVETALPEGTTVAGIAAAGLHSVALTTSGQELAWGDNTSGQSGNGTSGALTTSPVLVTFPGNAQVTAVAAGLNQNLAISPSGVAPGPNGGDGATAATAADTGTIVGTALLALAGAGWLGLLAGRITRRIRRPGRGGYAAAVR